MRKGKHYTHAELEYMEMTPKQLADFQATPRPLPGSVTVGYAVVAVVGLIAMWRVLAYLGYFV